MKKIFLLALTCTISYLSLANNCNDCKGGGRTCCAYANGDTYYENTRNIASD